MTRALDMAKFYLDRYFAKAERVRFDAPVYDYYEDEYGDEQSECVREGTSKRDLCKQVQKTNAPIYYFRRHVSRAREDKHFIKHHYGDRYNIIAKTWGRRVLIMPQKMHKQLTVEAIKTFDKTPKIKYNSPLDKSSEAIKEYFRETFDINTALTGSSSS